MADSFIHDLTESIRLKYSDVVPFDIYDPDLDIYNSERISFYTINKTISSLLIPQINGSFVRLIGDTLTGYLTLHHDPIIRMHAANMGYVLDGLSSLSSAVDDDFANFKVYVDNLIASINGNASNLSQKFSNFVHLSGDALTGYLTLHHAPISSMHAANMGYVDDGLSALSSKLGSNFGNFVHLSGDTMQGPLDFNGSKIKRYTVDVLSENGNFNIDSNYNGSVILIDSTSQVIANVIQDSLPVGFNAVLIQMNTGAVKIGTTGSVSVINVNNALLTRKKYAQMNFCVVKPNVVWISGDIV